VIGPGCGCAPNGVPDAVVGAGALIPNLAGCWMVGQGGPGRKGSHVPGGGPAAVPAKGPALRVPWWGSALVNVSDPPFLGPTYLERLPRNQVQPGVFRRLLFRAAHPRRRHGAHRLSKPWPLAAGDHALPAVRLP